jgi:RNA polymerase sigma-70 factor (ECF subfamily)
VAADDPDAPHGPALPEATWVQPLPGPAPDDPAAVVATRGSVRLALVVALQTLPPKQRAALILRDVLGWRAAEVADLLGVTPVAVNSALQRARAQLEGITEDDVAEGAHDALLDRYAKAFDNADVETLVRLLHEDVTLEMPPEPFWFAGRERVGRFLGRNVLTGPGLFRLLPVTANGQPAAATYWRPADGLFHAHAIQVLTVAREQVTRIVVFRQPTLFPSFGLPMTATPVPPGSR